MLTYEEEEALINELKRKADEVFEKEILEEE